MCTFLKVSTVLSQEFFKTNIEKETKITSRRSMVLKFFFYHFCPFRALVNINKPIIMITHHPTSYLGILHCVHIFLFIQAPSVSHSCFGISHLCVRPFISRCFTYLASFLSCVRLLYTNSLVLRYLSIHISQSCLGILYSVFNHIVLFRIQ